MKEYKLTERIIELSEVKNWDTAKLEWQFERLYISEEDKLL